MDNSIKERLIEERTKLAGNVTLCTLWMLLGADAFRTGCISGSFFLGLLSYFDFHFSHKRYNLAFENYDNIISLKKELK